MPEAGGLHCCHPPTRASPCLQPRRLLRASLVPASPLQQLCVRALGGCRGVRAAQGRAGPGWHCCTGSQAKPPQRANREHEAALVARAHLSTKTLVPADAPCPPPRAPDPLSHPTTAAAENTVPVAEQGSLRCAHLAPCIYLTAEHSCFSLCLLTGCKFAAGWQLQAVTAWEEPQGCFCQAVEGHPTPRADCGSRGLQIRLMATRSLSLGRSQEIPKSLQGAGSFLLASPEARTSLRRRPFGISRDLLAATPRMQVVHPLRAPRCR